MQFQQLPRKDFFIKIESALKEYVDSQIYDAWLKLMIILIFRHSSYICREKYSFGIQTIAAGEQKFL